MIHTQADGLITDSLAVSRGTIVGVGRRLQHDPEFKGFERIDLKGRSLFPGFVDAHTHFYHHASYLGAVSLEGVSSFRECLNRIRQHAGRLAKNDWVVGFGYSPDAFSPRFEPNAAELDSVTGDHPALIFYKDTHTAWVNSKALRIAKITGRTKQPEGAHIDMSAEGRPTGILREMAAYEPVYRKITPPSEREMMRRYRMALEQAYRNGVTGVHSFDGPEGFEFFSSLAMHGKLGLRINYYPPARLLGQLEKSRTRYGCGDDFLRVAGIKLFADGALGSQTAFCFNKYRGSKDNYGMEVLTASQITKIANRAGRLGLPCAIHAIGDRANAGVLDALEAARPLPPGRRHRIEHLQLIRRKDISRIRRLNVVASMQPSHCPSDIDMVRAYWGKRGANAYIFRTLIDSGVDLAFGSDAPIEPLEPIAGIAAAVRRARSGSRDLFYPEQRITAAEAVFRFTVGPAIACGQADCRGYLLPGYPADLTVLDADITRVPATAIERCRVLATFVDGRPVYVDKALNF